MRVSCFSRWSICVCAAALLAGCGGQSPIGVPGAMPQSPAIATHAERGGSWMLPEAKSEDLLYESDIKWASVYSYPQGKLVGRLKGFYLAAGQCVDNSTGNVYISDYAYSRVYKYAHGSTHRKRGYYVPDVSDCSIDPTTGNLAAASWGGAGVWVFPNASGRPKKYTDPDFFGYYSLGYDANGSLLVDGTSAPGSGHVVFAELPKGGNKLKTIAVGQYFSWPAGVKWDGKEWAAGDGNIPVIYQVVIKAGRGTTVGRTHLGSGLEYMHNFWIQDQRALTSGQCYTRCYGERYNQAIMYFNYPAGGTATKLIRDGIRASSGDSVSLAPRR